MMEFKFEIRREKDTLLIRATGFAVFDKIRHLKDTIINELAAMDGHDYKVIFDLRGLKALDPRAAQAMGEIDDYLCTKSTAIKIGTILDSIVAKVQHIRIAREKNGTDQFASGRAQIFTNADECFKWMSS